METCLSLLFSKGFSKGLLVFGICAAPAAMAQGLPAELPVPPGATITRVEHVDFGQDEFSCPNSNRATEYVKVAGHLWRAFLKGDQTSLGVPAWKAALEPSGWQVLNQTPGNTVARRGDWWAKIGLDRLTLIQRTEAATLQLPPPGDKIEELKPNQDCALHHAASEYDSHNLGDRRSIRIEGGEGSGAAHAGTGHLSPL